MSAERPRHWCLVAAVVAAGACGSSVKPGTGPGGTGGTGMLDAGTVKDVARETADSGNAEIGDRDTGAAGDHSAADTSADVDLGPRPTPLTWVRETSGTLARVIGGTGPNDVWLVGDAGNIWHSEGDGIWKPRRPSTAGRATGVWGSSPDNVYVSLFINLVLRWNGTDWERQTDGIPIGVTFNAVWGSGPNDIYIGDPSLYHSNGDGRWEGIRLPLTTGAFQSIWGSGPNDVWALGGTGIARKRSDGSWTTEFPGPMSGLQKIW
ncbi:MAG TPA: hypothetical protein VIY86_12760, partial [Pirellulaceae bacterium]